MPIDFVGRDDPVVSESLSQCLVVRQQPQLAAAVQIRATVAYVDQVSVWPNHPRHRQRRAHIALGRMRVGRAANLAGRILQSRIEPVKEVFFVAGRTGDWPMKVGQHVD